MKSDFDKILSKYYNESAQKYELPDSKPYTEKEDFCKTHPAIGYSTELGGIWVHGFEYGVNDYIYCTTDNPDPKKSDKMYHRLKVETRLIDGEPYFRLYGKRVFLNTIIRL